MADAANESTLAILKDTPDYFSNVLCKLRVCHDLCIYSDVGILGSEVEGKIAQCSVDFRHVSIQTAILAERVGSNWCGTCIVFFENIDKITRDPSIVMNRISKQALELSKGFALIAEWIRKLAGRFHDCQKLAGKDKEKYMESVEDAKKHAEEKKQEAEESRKRARKELESRKKSSGIWGICACIPIVNIVALPGYLVSKGDVSDARHSESIALQELETAKKELEKAGNALKKAEIAAKHIKDLILALTQVEEICEAQAAFWNYQSNKFSSFSTQITDAEALVAIGIDDSVKELLAWLKERKRELAIYHEVMQGVNNSFNFPCELKPTKFPALALPTLGITLE